MAPLLVLLLCTPLVTCYVLDLPNSLSLVITVDPDPVTDQCSVKQFGGSIKTYLLQFLSYGNGSYIKMG